MALVSALMVLPALAFHRHQLDPVWLAGWFVTVNLLTWFLYGYDKRCAETAAWRIPENILHLCEIAGGWPAALLAQRWFRHKTSKASYQVVFWLIVLLHQYAAFDSLQDWKLSRSLLEIAARQR